jgi:hypothetical protein
MATRKSPTVPAKNDAAPRKAAAPRQRTNGVPPFEGDMRPNPSPEQLWKQIAEAAYYKAKARHFAPGGEVQDWIEAEAEVMNRLGRSP